jgi:hypothetical protein
MRVVEVVPLRLTHIQEHPTVLKVVLVAEVMQARHEAQMVHLGPLIRVVEEVEVRIFLKVRGVKVALVLSS